MNTTKTHKDKKIWGYQDISNTSVDIATNQITVARTVLEIAAINESSQVFRDPSGQPVWGMSVNSEVNNVSEIIDSIITKLRNIPCYISYCESITSPQFPYEPNGWIYVSVN